MNKCPRCKLTVYWGLDALKKHKQCYNPDGSIHWDTCSSTRRHYAVSHVVDEYKFNKGRNKGNIKGVVYRNMDNATKSMHMEESSGVITGKYYKDTGDRSVPWEVK